jgi:hypothetical protein
MKPNWPRILVFDLLAFAALLAAVPFVPTKIMWAALLACWPILSLPVIALVDLLHTPAYKAHRRWTIPLEILAYTSVPIYAFPAFIRTFGLWLGTTVATLCTTGTIAASAYNKHLCAKNNRTATAPPTLSGNAPDPQEGAE